MFSKVSDAAAAAAAIMLLQHPCYLKMEGNNFEKNFIYFLKRNKNLFRSRETACPLKSFELKELNVAKAIPV